MKLSIQKFWFLQLSANIKCLIILRYLNTISPIHQFYEIKWKIGYEYHMGMESLDIWPFCKISKVLTSPIFAIYSQSRFSKSITEYLFKDRAGYIYSKVRFPIRWRTSRPPCWVFTVETILRDAWEIFQWYKQLYQERFRLFRRWVSVINFFQQSIGHECHRIRRLL